MKSGDYEAACQAFEQSLALHLTPGVLLNLALSEQQLGREAKALEHFEHVASLLEPKDERHSLALAKIRELQERAAKETSATPPASERREGPPPPTAARAVTAPDGDAPDKTVPQAMAARPPSGGAPSGWAFVLAGAGATALGVSAVTGVVAVSMKNDALDHCQAKLCDRHGLEAADGARWYGAVSTGALIGGLLSMGAASYFFFRRESGTANEVAVGVSSSPGQTQLVVLGSL
jgi:tetratricopeptide (TPR) repeat protein